MSYTPFAKMTAQLAEKPGVSNPAGLAASIAAKKYGRPALEQAAAKGTSLKGKPKKGKHSAALSKFMAQHHGAK